MSSCLTLSPALKPHTQIKSMMRFISMHSIDVVTQMTLRARFYVAIEQLYGSNIRAFYDFTSTSMSVSLMSFCLFLLVL